MSMTCMCALARVIWYVYTGPSGNCAARDAPQHGATSRCRCQSSHQSADRVALSHGRALSGLASRSRRPMYRRPRPRAYAMSSSQPEHPRLSIRRPAWCTPPHGPALLPLKSIPSQQPRQRLLMWPSMAAPKSSCRDSTRVCRRGGSARRLGSVGFVADRRTRHVRGTRPTPL